MMSDESPKSAIELAMERLRRSDTEAGVEAIALSDEQKSAIAEARQVCEAKLAEQQILHGSKSAATLDPEARAELEEQHRRDIARVTGDRDRKIASIRQAGS